MTLNERATWGRGTITGSVATSWSSIAVQGFSAVRTAWLARLLVPELFGIVALAEVFLTTMRQFLDFQLDMALLYRQERVEHTMTAHLCLKAVLGFTVFGLIGLGHSWLNHWYDPRVGQVLFWLGACSVIQHLGSTPRALLEREFHLTRVAAVQIISAIARLVIPVILALQGWGLLSLVMASVIDMIIPALGFWWARPLRRMPWPSREDLRWMFRFSWPLWIAGLLSVVCFSFDKFLIGTLYDAEHLGFYSLAFLFARLPVQSIVHAIDRAVFPAYARFQQQPATVAKLFQLVVSCVSWALLPAATSMALLAPDIIPLVLGEPWRLAIPLFQSLCLFTVLRGLHDVILDVLASQGRTTWFRNAYICEAIVLVLVGPWVAQRAGALGMAWVMNAMVACGLLYLIPHLARVITVPLWSTMKTPLAVSGMMAVVTWIVTSRLSGAPAAWRASLQCLAAGGTFLMGGWWLGRQELRSLRHGLRALWRGEWE